MLNINKLYFLKKFFSSLFSQLFASVTFEVVEESKVRLNYYLLMSYNSWIKSHSSGASILSLKTCSSRLLKYSSAPEKAGESRYC